MLAMLSSVQKVPSLTALTTLEDGENKAKQTFTDEPEVKTNSKLSTKLNSSFHSDQEVQVSLVNICAL